VARVGAVGLGAALGAAQAGGLGGLGQVRGDPGPLQLLDHVPPAGAALQRQGHLLPPAKRSSQTRSCKRSAGTIRPLVTSPVS
jgi:hypothetical protein